MLPLGCTGSARFQQRWVRACTLSVAQAAGACMEVAIACGAHRCSYGCCAGQDSGESFRAWVSELAPGLLQGHMEHDARAEVGLQRHWYVAASVMAACDSCAPQLLDYLTESGTA